MILKGRAAVITGANRGLGKAIAEAFVDAGASVLLTAREEPLLYQVQDQLRQRAGEGQQVHAMRGDVSDAASCDAVARQAISSFGKVTILVNNAGIYGPMGNIESVDFAEWVKAVQINLFGVVLMCRALIPHFRANGYGKIVNLSGGGATAPLPRISAYAASKAAVVRLTETFAEELKEAKVDVNAIAPGALNTRLMDEVLAAGPDKVGADFFNRTLKQRDEGGAPMEKGSALTVFLGSSASDGITGRLLSAVWDKWAELPSHLEELQKSDIYTLRRITEVDRGKKW